MIRLEVREVRKSFGTHAALQGVDLHVADAEILALLGPSGCGKTTLLRVIAGLEKADAGTVTFDGRPMDGVPVHLRRFGLMFQDYALFPHLNVEANIAYGLRFQNLPRAECGKRVAELLNLVGLEGFGARDVAGLSGGERQRVALARSLAPAPRLLMLDEPLAALDRTLRDHLGLEIRTILKQVDIPAILVTHDQGEAFAMADRVAVLDGGRILQCDTPTALYANPADEAVARFIGLVNVVRDGRLHATLCEKLGRRGVFLVRPDAALAGEGTGIRVEGTVRENVFRGQHHQVRMEILGKELVLRMDAPLPVGEGVVLWLDERKVQNLESD